MLFAALLSCWMWLPGTFKSCETLSTVKVTAIPSQHYARRDHPFFHKKLGVFSASPFSKAPNLPMVSCFCTLLYAVQTIPKEPKETIIKHLMEKLEMLILHA